MNQTKYLFGRDACVSGLNGIGMEETGVQLRCSKRWFRSCGRKSSGLAIGQTWLFDLARNLRRIIDCDRTSLLATNLQGCQKLDDLHHALATRAMPDRRFGGG